MAVAVTATVTGASTPQKVSVVLSGLTIGGAYAVTGVWAGGSWPVRGGVGVATAAQVVLADVATPVNVPITYQVVATSGSAVSAAVTVTYPGRGLFASLTGEDSAGFLTMVNDIPRSVGRRSVVLAVAGRADPVVVTDAALSDSGQLVVQVDPAGDAALRALLADGGVVLSRNNGAVPGLPAAEHLAITEASAAGYGPGATGRRWTIGYQVVAMPEPTTALALSTWDDFDRVYAASTWADFDAEWASLTWELADRTDWSVR